MKSSITKRWVRGSLFFTLAVLLVAEGVFLYFTVSGYYKDARQAMYNQFTALFDLLKQPVPVTQDDRFMRMIQTVEQFEEKGRFELMLVNASGGIEATSSGMLLAYAAVEPDIAQAALASSGGVGYYVGRTAGGERVMAVTMSTPYRARGVAAMRLVTSLSGVDRAIFNIVLASGALLAAILAASIMSGIYFIRSIVYPLRRVETGAARIAEGDFDIRVDNSAADEIGSLCTAINNMAEELGKSERMKNEFISSVSHELRTPLTAIKGWAETVSRLSDPSDPGFRRGLGIIAGETERLYGMVEELLDFSRMQSGLSLACERLDLAAEVEDAVLLSGQRAAELGVALVYNPPELPVQVMADKNRIRQVMVNLLDNALKYSFTGGTVNVKVEEAGKNALVSVADNGQGIAADDLKNVKVRFFKGQGALRGSGIGLAVVDEVVAAHGGEVKIESEHRQGTAVTVLLPLHSPQRGLCSKEKREGAVEGAGVIK